MSVVLPEEGDSIVVKGDETMVGDGNAVSVASQIVEDLHRMLNAFDVP
jgi:hypothetical protein